MAAFNSPIDGKLGNRREPFFVKDKNTMGLEHFYVPAHYQDTLDGLLIPFGAISDRVEKLAYDITQDYNGQTIHLICVLKGLFKFDFVFMNVLIMFAHLNNLFKVDRPSLVISAMQ